jgi:Ca2+:H+ antiporter
VVLVVLLCSYLCYLAFQLKTHKELFEGSGEEGSCRLSLTAALIGLGLITVTVACASE